MSIYVTFWDIDADDHDLSCARMRKVPGYEALWEQDDTRPCTCQAGPIAYQRSHVLPSDDDPRAGVIDLGAIPGFISRGDRVLCGDDDQCPKPATVCCDRYWPWLRASVGGETVVLTRDHVSSLHQALGDWLMRSDPGGGS